MSNRLASIDVLRGTCLVGILVMNIQSFAMPHAAYLNPSVYGSLGGAEGVAWVVGRLLFDFKFLSLFSMLFGASLILAGDERPRRRLGWLIVFGLLHGYLVWYGDVLFTYGLVGLLVLGARAWDVRRQLAVGGALLVVPPALTALGGVYLDAMPRGLVESVVQHLDARTVAGELAAYRGGWLAQLPIRAALSLDGQTAGLLLETGWRAAGCMMLGMAAVRSGVFEGRLRSPGVIFALLSLGAAVTGLGVVVAWRGDFAPRPWLIAQGIHELGAIPLAIGLGLGVVALAHAYPEARATRAIGTLGRFAFTAYLMHSIVGTWVFGGQGLGLFGRVDRVTLLLLPFAVWGGQLAMASWWAARYRVGPLEALWRGLARGQWSLGPVRPASEVGSMEA